MDQNVWIIYFILLWLGLILVPRFLFKRAIFDVIQLFQKNHSLCTETPKTAIEMGLRPAGFKPLALQMLYNGGVIRYFEDGRLCLLEEKVSDFLETNKLS